MHKSIQRATMRTLTVMLLALAAAMLASPSAFAEEGDKAFEVVGTQATVSTQQQMEIRILAFFRRVVEEEQYLFVGHWLADNSAFVFALAHGCLLEGAAL